MFDMYRINVSVLKSYEKVFNNELNYFNNTTYNTFSSSYLKNCSDSYVQRMASQLDSLYSKLKNGYQNIDSWWSSYNENIEALENYLSDKGSVGSISEDSIRNTANGMPFLRKFNILFAGIVPPAIASSNSNTLFANNEVISASNIFSSLFSEYDVNAVNADEVINNNNVTVWYEEVKCDVSNFYQNVFVNSSSKEEFYANLLKLYVFPTIEKASTVLDEKMKSVAGEYGTKIVSVLENSLKFASLFLTSSALSEKEPAQETVESDNNKTNIYNEIAANNYMYTSSGMPIITCDTTSLTALTSVGEGIAELGESIGDTALVLGTGVTNAEMMSNPYSYDNVNDIDLSEERWKITQAEVSKQNVKSSFDYMYENTDFGQNLKENTFEFDTVREIGKAFGYEGGTILLGLGVGAAASVGSKAVSVTPKLLGWTTSVASFGKNVERAWVNGADVNEGLVAGSVNSAWDGFQAWLGTVIGTKDVFGTEGIIKAIGSNGIKTKFLNSAARVVLDGVDSGFEAIVLPGISSIYKEGYTNENGKFIEFTDDQNFVERYGLLWEENGGVKELFTQAFVGAGMSLLGESFDLTKFIRDSKKVPDIDVSNKNTNKGIMEEITIDDSGNIKKQVDEIVDVPVNKKAGVDNKNVNNGIMEEITIDESRSVKKQVDEIVDAPVNKKVDVNNKNNNKGQMEEIEILDDGEALKNVDNVASPEIKEYNLSGLDQKKILLLNYIKGIEENISSSEYYPGRLRDLIIQYVENKDLNIFDIRSGNAIQQISVKELCSYANLDIDEVLNKRINILKSVDNFFENIRDSSYKSYGVDQGILTKISYNLFSKEYKHLKSKLKSLGFSGRDAHIILSHLDSTGACSYAEVCNEIVNAFSNSPETFEKLFGYTLFKNENGKLSLNSSELLLDIYLYQNNTVNGGEIFTIKDGQASINNNYFETMKELFEGKADTIFMDTHKQKYMSYYSGNNISLISNFLKSKSELLNYNSNIIYFSYYDGRKSHSEFDKTIEDVFYRLTNGEQIGLDIFQETGKKKLFRKTEFISDPIRMINMNNGKVVSTRTWNEGGGHAVYITGMNNEGFIVSSWGGKYLIPFEDLKQDNAMFSINSSTITSGDSSKFMIEPNISKEIGPLKQVFDTISTKKNRSFFEIFNSHSNSKSVDFNQLTSAIHTKFDGLINSNIIDNVLSSIRIVDYRNWKQFLYNQGISHDVLAFADVNNNLFLPSDINMNTAVYQILNKISSWKGTRVKDVYGNIRNVTGLIEFYSDGSNTDLANSRITEYFTSKLFDSKMNDDGIYSNLIGRFDDLLSHVYNDPNVLLKSYVMNDKSILTDFLSKYSTQANYHQFMYAFNSPTNQYTDYLNNVISELEDKIYPKKATFVDKLSSIFKKQSNHEYQLVYNKGDVLKKVCDPVNNYSNLDAALTWFFKNEGFLQSNPYRIFVTAIGQGKHKDLPSNLQVNAFYDKFRYGNGYYTSSQNNSFTHVWSSPDYSDEIVATNRLYLNAGYDDTYKFAQIFADKCKDKNIPFYFKVANFRDLNNYNKFSLLRDESIVIYAEDSYIADYVNICNEIKKENPDFKFDQPPIFTGNIDGFIGYGSELPKSDTSYNDIRSKVMLNAILKTYDEFVKYDRNFNFFEIKKNSDYYLKFLDSVYKNIKDCSIEYGIAPNNFAFYR